MNFLKKYAQSVGMNFKMEFCSYEAAKYACKNWHYSKSMPVGKLVKVGVWENDKFIGVVIFGRGAAKDLLSPYGLTQDRGCELTRIALKKHKTFVSKIMMIAIKFLKKLNPNLELIVSFADADQDHIGSIYQATNWIYTGLKNKNKKSAFIINGKKTHPKSIQATGVKQSLSEIRKYLDPRAELFISKGKHCYLMPLNKKMRKNVIKLSKKYPKRNSNAV